MNEEESFIQSIVASPQDAAVKLVYADWLEERGDPRSEFLRLEVQLSQMDEQDEQYQAVREKHRTAYEKCDSVWREQVGFPYDVILEGYYPFAKLNTVKLIREATELGLAVIKGMVESAPTAIKTNISRLEAERIKVHVESPIDTSYEHLLAEHLASGGSPVSPGKGTRVRMQLSKRSGA